MATFLRHGVDLVHTMSLIMNLKGQRLRSRSETLGRHLTALWVKNCSACRHVHNGKAFMRSHSNSCCWLGFGNACYPRRRRRTAARIAYSDHFVMLFKVTRGHRSDTNRSDTYGLPSVIHSNYMSVLSRYRDNQRLPPRNAHFHTSCILRNPWGCYVGIIINGVSFDPQTRIVAAYRV